MVSLKFSVFFWAVLVLFAQFHLGYSLFLGYKKDLLKYKLHKLKEALSDHHDGYEEVHIYKPAPIYVSTSHGKWNYGWPSSSYGWSSGSYGWPSYGGWSH